MDTTSSPDLPGAESVTSWFGQWPTFHDAEILALHLNREEESWLKLHAWLLTSETYEQDGKHYLRTDRHAVVTFHFAEIIDLELADFSGQNVISGLEVEKAGDGYRLTLQPCFGLAGYIHARGVSVELEPGRHERATRSASRDA
jgi:hypothetical protein